MLWIYRKCCGRFGSLLTDGESRDNTINLKVCGNDYGCDYSDIQMSALIGKDCYIVDFQPANDKAIHTATYCKFSGQGK